MEKMRHHLRTRLTALLLALVCVLGLLPTAAFAASDTIKLKNFGMSGVAYQSKALGRCTPTPPAYSPTRQKPLVWMMSGVQATPGT